MTARPARPGELRLPGAYPATSRPRTHRCNSTFRACRRPMYAVPLTGLPSFCAFQCSYDIIYEARDLDLPQSVRDGFTQVGIRAYGG